MVTAGSLDLQLSLGEKIRLVVRSLAFKTKAFSLDFGYITLHDYNDWRETPSKKKPWDQYESVTDLPSSDCLDYFAGFKL